MSISIYDEKFQNWLKGVFGQNATRIALCECISGKIENYIKDIPNSELKQFFYCLKSNQIYRLKTNIKHGNLVKRWKCRHDRCKVLMEGFIDNHTDKHTFVYIWEELQSSSRNNVTEHGNEVINLTWNVMMLYMHIDRNKSTEDYSSLESLDISHVIKIMRNFKPSSPDGSAEAYEKVLVSRNELMHSPSNTMNEDETQNILTWYRKLLDCLCISEETYYKEADKYLQDIAKEDFVIYYQSKECEIILEEVLKAEIMADKLYQYINDENLDSKKQSKQLLEVLENIDRFRYSKHKRLEMKRTEYISQVKDKLVTKHKAIVMDKAESDGKCQKYKMLKKLEKKTSQEIMELQKMIQTPEVEELVDVIEKLKKVIESLKEEQKKQKAEANSSELSKMIQTSESEEMKKLKKDIETLKEEQKKQKAKANSSELSKMIQTSESEEIEKSKKEIETLKEEQKKQKAKANSSELSKMIQTPESEEMVEMIEKLKKEIETPKEDQKEQKAEADSSELSSTTKDEMEMEPLEYKSVLNTTLEVGEKTSVMKKVESKEEGIKNESDKSERNTDQDLQEIKKVIQNSDLSEKTEEICNSNKNVHPLIKEMEKRKSESTAKVKMEMKPSDLNPAFKRTLEVGHKTIDIKKDEAEEEGKKHELEKPGKKTEQDLQEVKKVRPISELSEKTEEICNAYKNVETLIQKMDQKRKSEVKMETKPSEYNSEIHKSMAEGLKTTEIEKNELAEEGIKKKVEVPEQKANKDLQEVKVTQKRENLVEKSETEMKPGRNLKDGTNIPIKWTAPEAAVYQRFSTKSDVWSYGILLVEMTTHGQVPYSGLESQDVLQQIERGYRHKRPQICPKPMYEMMLKCWDQNPEERPTFKCLLKFFDDYFFVAEPSHKDFSFYAEIYDTV